MEQAPGTTTGPKDGLSYKFQRVRERLRASVVGGELSGKLPGERTLARRFHVNAKTLSKALTDLAAEGLLDRNIGRGTYVRGGGDAAAHDPARATPWLIVCDRGRADAALLRLIEELNPAATVLDDLSAIRPSLLRQFDAVIDLGPDTPDAFLRDLIVRNVRVIAVDREPDVASVTTVAPDRALGAASLARDLALAGHVRMAVVETLPRSLVARTIGATARRYRPDAGAWACTVDEALAAAKDGATAVICDSVSAARDLRDALEAAGLRLAHDVSLAAVGCSDDAFPCSGQFVDARVLARTLGEMLAGGVTHRPTARWLAPRWVDRGTVGPVTPR